MCVRACCCVCVFVWVPVVSCVCVCVVSVRSHQGEERKAIGGERGGVNRYQLHGFEGEI